MITTINLTTIHHHKKVQKNCFSLKRNFRTYFLGNLSIHNNTIDYSQHAILPMTYLIRSCKPFLFKTVLEVVATTIRQQKEIRGTKASKW